MALRARTSSSHLEAGIGIHFSQQTVSGAAPTPLAVGDQIQIEYSNQQRQNLTVVCASPEEIRLRLEDGSVWSISPAPANGISTVSPGLHSSDWIVNSE